MTLKDVVARIEGRLAELEITAAWASREAGLSEDAIRNMQRAAKDAKRKGVSTATINALAPVLQVTPNWLMTGDDAAGAEPTRGDIANLAIRGGLGSGGLLTVEADATTGAILPEFVDGYWSFPGRVRDQFRNIGKTHALPVVGDSMEPTLINGSVVFVDTTHTAPSPPDLYAVDYGDGLMVKRIELIPRSRKVRVISDNDRYSSYEMARDELLVFGRVVAWFQWRG